MFFLCVKMPNKYCQKTKKSSAKKHMKDVKIFLQKEQTKSEKIM